ncbi:ABC transporter permease [Lacrimispora sp.]|uniref:ABC transporter permease n=1 Tax=Lacrimispora sp. TaxID=2719234 RepID=UPI0028ACEBC2|nr:ABC transporter permease [Lacrimispora sp.]
MMSIILGVIEEGLVYAIMALGVYITYKILDFPDLSVDGTFPLGGAITAVLVLAGVNPLLALFLAFIAGALAGCITGIIHVKLKVRDLLSGIIVMTALYSVNLRLVGKSNVAFFNSDSIFSNPLINKIMPQGLSEVSVIVILVVIVLIAKILLDLFLKTRSGYLLRAVGDNETLVTSLAKDKGTVKILGLSIANGLAALAGSVYCQQKGFFDISMGTGTIVIGLANVIIGTKLLKRFGAIKATTAVIVGSIVYKACVSLAIFFGMEASDLRIITSALFLGILVISNGREKKVKNHA